MRRLFLFLVLLALMAGGALWWLKFEHEPPSIELAGAGVLGRRAAWDVVASAPGLPGLRRVEVRLISGDKTLALFEEDFAPINFLGSGIGERRFRIETDLARAGVREGEGRLQAIVETYAWRVGAPRQTMVERSVTIDLTPPAVELLTTQHNMRLGGAEVVVFRTSPDAVYAGVAVKPYFFPATRGYFTDPNAAVAIFAVPQDLSAEARPQIEVSDAAGNARTVPLPCQIKERKFPERTFHLDDDFLDRKVPELVSINRLPAHPDVVTGYLFINGEFRRETEKRLREITAKSTPAPLWDGVFRRQSNAAPMSAFADRRLYSYKGEIIDRQTHLGYDLASLKGAPVEAAQNGVVVFAGDLGIYGDTVVLDHGLGIFSLYGHLRSIAVSDGQRIEAGAILGQTGESGLAGGDHLHFSIMLYGTHIDPVEWWDPRWLRDHVTAKLTLLPVAASAAAANVQEGANEQGKPRGADSPG